MPVGSVELFKVVYKDLHIIIIIIILSTSQNIIFLWHN